MTTLPANAPESLRRLQARFDEAARAYLGFRIAIIRPSGEPAFYGAPDTDQAASRTFRRLAAHGAKILGFDGADAVEGFIDWVCARIGHGRNLHGEWPEASVESCDERFVWLDDAFADCSLAIDAALADGGSNDGEGGAGGLGDSGTAGYRPAWTLKVRHGIRPQHLSAAKHDGKVRWKPAPPGYSTDPEGRAVRVLYHEADAVKHCAPKRLPKGYVSPADKPDAPREKPRRVRL